MPRHGARGRIQPRANPRTGADAGSQFSFLSERPSEVYRCRPDPALRLRSVFISAYRALVIAVLRFSVARSLQFMVLRGKSTIKSFTG